MVRIMPNAVRPKIRGATSRGSHVRALFETMLIILETLEGPENAQRRVSLRNHMAALCRAYPELDGAIELAQAVEEMDGLPQED